jgi:hypothetical protein
MRIEGKKVPSLEPYGKPTPVTPPIKKDLRKLGAWIKAKRLADEIKRERQSSVPEVEKSKE